MSGLAGRPFVKMNGIGNEILVLDLRTEPVPVAAEAARALARPAAVPFDQLMALYPPRVSGTEAFVRIFNSDGSEAGACGNGMRCIAMLAAKASGKHEVLYETPAGLIACTVAATEGSPSTWASRASLGRKFPLAEEFRDTRMIELQIGPDRCTGAALALGGERGQSARGLLGRRRERPRPRPPRPAAGEPSDLSRARQHLGGAGEGRRIISSCAPGSAAPA